MSFVVLLGCSYKLLKRGRINQQLLSEIMSSVERSRGLKFKSKVEIKISNKKEVKQFLEENIARELPPEELQKMNELLVFVGLLEPGIDLKKELVNFVGEAGAGFYDQYGKRLILVEEVASKSGLLAFVVRRDIMNELILAHELTHAIDDQNFDLQKTMERYKDNDDAATAMHWVEEGASTIVGFAHLLQKPSTDERVLAIVRQFNSMNTMSFKSEYPDTPEVLKDVLLSPYEKGSNFVMYHLKTSKGWDNVNEMYSGKPISTEMILHPERSNMKGYLPIEVKLPELPKATVGSLEKMEDNVTGEFMTHLILERFVSWEEARRASDGWGGDLYAIYNTKGKPRKFLMWWLSKWDTEKDAVEFSSAAIRMLRQKHQNSLEEQPPTKIDGILFEAKLADGQIAVVAGAGDTVLYVEGVSNSFEHIEKWWSEILPTISIKPAMAKQD